VAELVELAVARASTHRAAMARHIAINTIITAIKTDYDLLGSRIAAALLT